MAHQDAQLTDVMIVLIDEPGMTASDAAARLKDLGLAVSDIDEENAVIEGTIETIKIDSLQTLLFVKYVRNLFNYVADFPTGDPRNLDQLEDEDIADVDDAGA
jgi:hypothetical protein